MRTRILAALLAVGYLALIATAPAAVASYGGDGGMTVDPSTPQAGGSITIDSSGWKANSSVTITLHSDPVTLGKVNADASGNLHATETIPTTAPAGAHTVALAGTDPNDAPRSVSADITVARDGSSLPRTGAAIAALVVIALVLFVAGSALSTARKRAIH